MPSHPLEGVATVIARIAGRGASALEPQYFGFAPVEAADRALAHSLRRAGGRWGVACICIGVGQGLAVVLENVTA